MDHLLLGSEVRLQCVAGGRVLLLGAACAYSVSMCGCQTCCTDCAPLPCCTHPYSIACLPHTDVVRKIIYGDVDLGIVGLDMLAEIGNDDPGELRA